MFTGIVEEAGTVERITPASAGMRLVVSAPRCLKDLKLGDSVAVNGCCLTVVGLGRKSARRTARFDLLQETWKRTSLQFLRPGSLVNLERPLPAHGRLDGHFVTGHIDGLGRITRWERAGADYVLEIQAPEEVQAAFADAVKAGQDRERQINEGQSYFNDVVPKAKGTAARLMQEGEGYRQSIIANAEGEASRFSQIVTEYSKAPVVTRERLYLDMMQSVLGNSSKVLVDQKVGSNSLLYLPLDKLIQQSAPAAAAGAADPSAGRQSTPPPAEPSVQLDPTRSREALRARERGTESR